MEDFKKINLALKIKFCTYIKLKRINKQRFLFKVSKIGQISKLNEDSYKLLMN